MKRKKSRWASIVLICLVSVLFALPAMVTGSEQSSKSSSQGNPIVIKLITHQAPPTLPDSTVPIFVDRVNARANGELIIKFMGGLEVIPLYEQFAALRSGAVDVITSPGSNIKDRIPEVMILSLSKKTSYGTPQTLKERKPGGVYEYVNKAFEREGIHFLGRAEAYQPWYIMGKKKIQSIKDMSKIMIGSGAPIHIKAIKSLGCTVIGVKPPDVYTALERGTIDAMVWPFDLHFAFSIPEVSKYLALPPFESVVSTFLAMRLNVWNSLPKHLQEIINEAAIFAERRAETSQLGLDLIRLRKLQQLNIETVEMQSPDRERVAAAYTTHVEKDLKETVSPEEFNKIMELARLE